MANTITHIYVHVILAVQSGQLISAKEHREEIEQYFSTLFQDSKTNLLANSCLPDHVHLFLELDAVTVLSNLIRDLKNRTSRFVNRKKWIEDKFGWQKGFGAFSYGQSHVNPLIGFIRNQESYHSHRSFSEEYQEILSRYNITNAEKYLFAEIA